MRFGWLTLSLSPSPEEDAVRIDQQIVQRHAVFARAIGEPSKRLVGAPMEIGRGELHLDPARIAVAAVKPFEQRDVVVERQLKTLEP